MDASHVPELGARGPLPLLDGAFSAVRHGGLALLSRALLAGTPLAIVVLAVYYLERVEGVRGLRPLFALALALAWYTRAVLLSRVARGYALSLRPELPVAIDRARVVDVVCTASVTGFGLWCWLWPLAGFAALWPYAAAIFLPVLALRGAVAPSWLARAACSRERGIAAFSEAVNDTAGMRGVFMVVELLALFGLLGLFANVFSLLSLIMLLGHSMLGLDVAFVSAFVSPENPLTLLVVAALTLLLAEPLRAAISAQAFVDARSRRDGADLHAAVDAVIAGGSRRGRRGLSSYPPTAAAALLIALAATASPVIAAAQEGMPSAALDDAEVREHTEAILRAPEFREFAEQDTRSLREWLEKLLRWLAELDEEEPEREPTTGPWLDLPPLSAEALVALGLIALALIAIYAAGGRRRLPATPSAQATPEDALMEQEPVSFLDEASRLAQRGEARAALRALYLATLVSLDRAALIDFEPSRTNWQYIRRMPRGELRELFAAFTRIFDHKWYGHEVATLDDYQRCRQLADRIYAAAVPRSPLEPARGGKVIVP